MSMSRKNYNAIATNFGFTLRGLNLIKVDLTGAWEMVNSFAEVAKQDNPNFNADRFRTWVQETADYLRDLDGKLVKGYKPSHSG